MRLPWQELLERAGLKSADPKDGGGESISQDDLSLNDLSVRPEIRNTLGEYLPIYGSPEEIIRVSEYAKKNPEIYEAVRDDGQRTCQGASCDKQRDSKKKKVEEDK